MGQDLLEGLLECFFWQFEFGLESIKEFGIVLEVPLEVDLREYIGVDVVAVRGDKGFDDGVSFEGDDSGADSHFGEFWVLVHN